MNWAFVNCIGHKTSFSLLVFSCQMGSLPPIISYESGSLKLVNSININSINISITMTVDQFFPELLAILSRLGIALELWLCLSWASLSPHLLPVTIHSLPSAYNNLLNKISFSVALHFIPRSYFLTSAASRLASIFWASIVTFFVDQTCDISHRGRPCAAFAGFCRLQGVRVAYMPSLQHSLNNTI